MKLHSFLAATAICALLASCKKENNSTGGSNVNYQLTASDLSSLPGITASDNSTLRTDATITWNSGFANVTELRFEARNKDNDITYRSKTDRRIDLFNPGTSAGSILIPSGDYDQVKFIAALAPANGEPALQLTGTYNGTPVILEVSQPIEIRGVQKNVTVTDNNGYTAITNLDLSNLFADVPSGMLNNATRTNGQIIISSSSNQNIYNKLVKHLREHDNECHWKHD